MMLHVRLDWSKRRWLQFLEFVRSIAALNARLKIWLIALLVLVGQSLSVSIAAAHDVDPGHAAHDCNVCLTVQVNDNAPPPADADFEAPPAVYWAVGEIESQTATLKALSGAIRARAPPF